jgi:anaerobic selenocysteine-containing dehydrogenase
MLNRRSFVKLTAVMAATAALGDFSSGHSAKAVVDNYSLAQVGATSDQWIKTECRICSTVDYVNVHVVNGVIDKIEGYPDTVHTRGKICSRGSSGNWYVYDPYRVKVPLKRTNPTKGVGVDPKWQEITWDEAYTTVANEAKKVRAKGKAGTMWMSEFSRLRYTQGELYTAFQQAMTSGTYQVEMGMNWCGHVMHYSHRLAHGSFADAANYLYTNYLLCFGSEQGFVYDSTILAEYLADAKKRGMKIVVVNPTYSYGSNLIDEWIPIKPATDGAFASAMLEVLVLETNTYDVDFVKKWTNGPYLVRSDNGYFARDATTGKPLVWDSVDNAAKTFDDKTIKDYALDGSFTVGGVPCNPSWKLFKDSIKTMTPEWAETITTVPAATIRRIAKEFGQAAQIGSKVVVNGTERALRPVSVIFQSNAANHVHGFANTWSVMLLLTILGAWDEPGSCCIPASEMSWTTAVADSTWKASKDGLIPHPAASYTMARAEPYAFKFPPETPELAEFFPFGDHRGVNSVMTMAHPNDYWNVGKNRKIEFGFGHCYSILSMYAVDWITDILSTTPFFAMSSIYLDEPTDFADIILPDRCYLEEYQVNANWLQQPVVDPLASIPHIYDTFMEICSKTGVLFGTGGFNDMVNQGFRFPDALKLDLNIRYTTEQIMDRACKNINGQGLDWWKQNGGTTLANRVIAPNYEWFKAKSLRLPIYVELHKRVADQLKANMDANSVQWDYRDYATLPTWIPSHIHQDTPPYDLIEVAYLQNTGGFLSTNLNPWLNEINAKLDPYSLYVWMNSDTAKAKGISEGDLIWVESEFAKRQAYAKLSQAIHPQVVAVSRHFGRYAGNSEVKDLNNKHLGLPHQSLRPVKLDYIDKLNVTLENCVKVKVYKG